MIYAVSADARRGEGLLPRPPGCKATNLRRALRDVAQERAREMIRLVRMLTPIAAIIVAIVAACGPNTAQSSTLQAHPSVAMSASDIGKLAVDTTRRDFDAIGAGPLVKLV